MEAVVPGCHVLYRSCQTLGATGFTLKTMCARRQAGRGPRRVAPSQDLQRDAATGKNSPPPNMSWIEQGKLLWLGLRTWKPEAQQANDAR